MWLKEICLVGLLVCALCASADGSYKVVCYLGSWANYRQGEGKYTIENIDPSLCTHLIYGFAKLGPDNKIAAYDPYLDLKENWGLGAFERFNNLKQKNPEVKTLIAIGGWNEGSTKYSNMAKDQSSRKVFTDSCVAFLKKYDFDGLDLDWEYPANRGGIPEDKQNFVALTKEMNGAFASHNYLLTAAVAAGIPTIDSAYDIPPISEYLDFINVMAYDFHGSWETFTGHHAALYARPEESGNQAKLNVDSAMNYWIESGASKEKLILGMGTYGRSFTLKDASANGLGATVTGKGTAGPITREGGMLGYNEICNALTRESGWTTVFDKDHQAPYAYKDKQWVGYDNVASINLKVEYLKAKGLGGGMIWSLETDDFQGKCHGIKYPLLAAINEGLNRPITKETVDPNIKVTNEVTPQPGSTTTSDYGSEEEPCPGEGMFRNRKDCQKFHSCDSSGRVTNRYTCGEGTAFDEKRSVCEHKHLVKECDE